MQYRDENALRELYVDEGLSIPQIADRFDVSNDTIWRWLNRHDIETRSPSEGKRKRHSTEPVPFITQKDAGYEIWQYRTTVMVHRLQAVALYGLDAIESKDIHHQNGIPWDNRPSNLDVLDPAEHSKKHAVSRHFTESVAQEIRDRYIPGGHPNQQDLADEYGVDDSTINHVVNRKGAYSED